MKNLRDIESSPFVLEGQFLGFIWDGNKIKYLRLAISNDELIIKLSREARASCKSILQPNDTIQITGETKIDRQQESVQFKALQITVKNDFDCLEELHKLNELKSYTCAITTETSATAKKVKLLLCRKSGCQKKGGKRQHQAIAELLRDRDLDRSVIIQETGCLGKCSLAPNIVLMPNKKRLSGMHPEAIVDLLARDLHCHGHNQDRSRATKCHRSQ